MDPTLSGDDLVQAVPDLRDMASISVEKVAQVLSSDISVEDWLKLACRINSALSEHDIQGVVLLTAPTHWKKQHTSLILLSKVKSQSLSLEPPYSLGTDGSANLFNAVAIACNPNAKAKACS